MKTTALSFLLFLLFFSLSLETAGQPNSTWSEVIKNKKGTITAYWDESRPFVYRNSEGHLAGIEFELLEGFKKYLNEKDNVDLTILWKEALSFNDIYVTIRDKKPGITFGVSAFSITENRQKEVGFSPPYMSDISVMITSDNVPILSRIDEFNTLLPKLTAITIEGTTYEQELLRLKDQGSLNFLIHYIPSSKNIMKTISETDSAFGFIDLPVYMMLFNEDPSIRVKRQNIYPIKREGYAIIYSQTNDWAGPLAAYFTNSNFKTDLQKIIGHYIDIELYQFIEGLAAEAHNNEVMLLTKEKEIQYKDLLGKSDQIIRETRTRNFLVALIAGIMFFLIIIIFLYRKRNEQSQKIKSQRKNIAHKSYQLEQRNKHLLALDEEKNNLIKILAHDLRTPISHIQGMAQIVLLENRSLPDDQKMMIQQIADSSVRVNKMISHLLDIDAIENNRVKALMDEVDINALSKKVASSFEKPAQLKNLAIVFTSNTEKCMIKGDALFLYEILENLISNALKFSFSGTKIEISVEEQKSNVIVRVKDEGPGLTKDDLQNLFKKFQRLSAQPTAGEGSFGLGLSIVKKYMEMMGGKVWCESRVNEGATFILEFTKEDVLIGH